MNQKKAKKIRKKLGLDLGRGGVEADHRVIKKTEKTMYTTDGRGRRNLIKVQRFTIVNAAKWQYRSLKKMINRGEVYVR